MKTFDDAARARIARGWTGTSLHQPTYAAQHGISERTLREWVHRFSAGRRPQAQLRAAVVAAIEQLQNVLAALDAEVADGSAATPEDHQEAVDHQVQRHAGLAGAATAVPDAGGPADVLRPAVVHEDEASVNMPELAGPVPATPATVAAVEGPGEAPASAGPRGEQWAGVTAALAKATPLPAFWTLRRSGIARRNAGRRARRARGR